MIINNITLKLFNFIPRHIILWTWTKGNFTNGCLNCEGVPTDGCSQLYVGDIEIKIENVVSRKISHDHEYEYLVSYNEYPISTSPSPLELQVVDQIKKKDEEEVPQQEPFFLEGSLRMDRKKIQEALKTLHGTHDLFSKICWRMEEKYSMEDI